MLVSESPLSNSLRARAKSSRRRDASRAHDLRNSSLAC
jgi:hypothetical protein